jgi:hypothetical protein
MDHERFSGFVTGHVEIVTPVTNTQIQSLSRNSVYCVLISGGVASPRFLRISSQITLHEAMLYLLSIGVHFAASLCP